MTGVLRADVTLQPTATAPRDARKALGSLADHVRRDVFEDLCLLVSELVTNSYLHADLPQDAGIVVRAELADDIAHVEISDRGAGFVSVLRRQPRTERGAGWGLALLDRLSSRWGIRRDDETSVWFEIDNATKRSY